MAKWNVFTKDTDETGRQEYLGYVKTEIDDTGEAQQTAERATGRDDVVVHRASHLVYSSHGHVQVKKD